MPDSTSPATRKLPVFHCQLLIAIVLLCSVMGCRGDRNSAHKLEKSTDLQQIKDSGELVVLTLYSSTSYFIYRGQDMGFQYELSEQFAQSLGVKLKIKVAGSVRDLISKLLAGEGDLIAYNLPITKEWKDSLIYCGEEVITHQVIVQRTGRGIKPRIIKALAGDNAVAILQMIGCVIGIGHDQDIIGPLVISKGIKPDNNAPMTAPIHIFNHNRNALGKVLLHKGHKGLIGFRGTIREGRMDRPAHTGKITHHSPCICSYIFHSPRMRFHDAGDFHFTMRRFAKIIVSDRKCRCRAAGIFRLLLMRPVVGKEKQ